MHLSEDAKVWWRSWYVDIQERCCIIDMWDALKKELCSQFFLENVEILARWKPRELKHINNIWDYVKQFAGLMLDIRDMSNKDKVLCFVEGFKPWAKTKLYEQRVQYLTSTYAAAEWLFDLFNDSQDLRRHQRSSSRKTGTTAHVLPNLQGDKRHSRDHKHFQVNKGKHLART